MRRMELTIRQPTVEFLSREEADEIHFHTLEVLERTGVNVHNPEARRLLYEAGAHVEGDLRVRLPCALVQRCLATAPGRIVMANRLGERTMALEPKRVYFGTGSDLKYTIDHQTGRRRETILADVAQAAYCSDRLPNIDFLLSYGLPSDVPAGDVEASQLNVMLRNSAKPLIMTVFSGRQALERMHRMACIVAGGEEQFRRNPFLGIYGQFTSPFQHSESDLDTLLFCSERAIPIIYIPTIMAGANGPATMAGALVEGNAEVLAGLVVSQLKRPGAPFIYGGCVSSFDMRQGKLPYGAPEWHMASAMLAQLSRRYGLPVFSTGGTTDSKTVDQQASIEAAYSILLAALSGANLIHDVGYMESGLTGSLEYLVICDEICAMARRTLRNFDISTETLAVELIDAVGPGGNYLTEDHTLAHYRRETWYPQLFDRSNHDRWAETGSTNLRDRAKERLERILDTPDPPPLDERVERELDAIVSLP